MLSIASINLFAQSNSLSITGQIVDDQDKSGLIGATVRLLSLPDSTVVKGTTTDSKGRFTLNNIKSGRYTLRATSVGYDDAYKEVTLGDKSITLSAITMAESSTFLDAVTVTGQAAPVTLKQDTVQFNTDAFKVKQGANVEDLLRRIPGMEIDDNGNVTYNGEAIERVELDGRNFFSSDPKMATRNLPSDMIKNVQVVDKKSDETRLTGMNDGEKVKVLNLVVKEDRKKGLIANSNLGYGTEKRYKADALVNIFNKDARYTILGNINNIDGVRRGRGDRTTRRIGGNYDNKWGDKLQVTSELYYSDNDDKSFGDKRTEQLLGGKSSNVESERYDDFRNDKRINFNSRIEWTPQESTMIMFIPEINFEQGKQRNASDFNTSSSDGVQINKGTSLKTDDTKDFNAGGTLHFRHTFNELGRNIYSRLWFDVDRVDGEGYNQSMTDFLLTQNQKVLDQLTQSRNDQFRIGANLAYLEPINKHWALQFNYRVVYQKRDNDQMAYTLDDQNQYSILDEDYSRGTKNRNVNHRFGLQLRYSFWGKSQLYVGIQANPTYTHTISTQGLKETFDLERTVWNYSPNLILELRPNSTLNFNLRYRGRTNHPSMNQLNPAVIIYSPLNRAQGNPELTPAFSHYISANGFYNNSKTRRSLNMHIDGGYTQNGVASIQKIDSETGVRTTTYTNVDGNQSYHGGFMFNTPLGAADSKFSSISFGHLMYAVEKGFVNGTANTSEIFGPNAGERFSWRGEKLQTTLGGFWGMQRVRNSLSKEQDRLTQNYNVFGEVVWQLPWDISFSSRLSYQDGVGYNDGIKRNFWLWDASLSWAFLKGKNASIEFSGYDLLRQRTSFRRTITANAITDTSVNGVMSYMMLTFSYRFSNMGGKQIQGDNRMGRRGYGGGHGHRH